VAVAAAETFTAVDPAEHIPLAVYLAKSFRRPAKARAIVFDDVVGEAYLGLVRARPRV